MRAIASVLLGALLFAQAALALARCDWLERSPSQAVAGERAEPCHETPGDSRNANLCLAHCQSELQSLDKPSVNVHAMPGTPVLSVPLAIANTEAAFRIATLSRLNPPGVPPPQFLAQVIRQ